MVLVQSVLDDVPFGAAFTRILVADGDGEVLENYLLAMSEDQNGGLRILNIRDVLTQVETKREALGLPAISLDKIPIPEAELALV